MSGHACKVSFGRNSEARALFMWCTKARRAKEAEAGCKLCRKDSKRADAILDIIVGLGLGGEKAGMRWSRLGSLRGEVDAGDLEWPSISHRPIVTFAARWASGFLGGRLPVCRAAPQRCAKCRSTRTLPFVKVHNIARILTESSFLSLIITVAACRLGPSATPAG